MYKANGLNFKNKKDYVMGTADIEWELYRNSLSDGQIDKMPSKEDFVKLVYDTLMGGVSNGVWSNIDKEGSSGSVEVPEEIRLLGEKRIKAAIAEFWENQDDKPVDEASESENHESTFKAIVDTNFYGVSIRKEFDSEKEAREYIKRGKKFDESITFRLSIVTEEVF